MKTILKIGIWRNKMFLKLNGTSFLGHVTKYQKKKHSMPFQFTKQLRSLPDSTEQQNEKTTTRQAKKNK